MRLRNIPGAQDAILESPYVVQEPQTKKGHWTEVFEKKQPLHIEVGMGKGRFLMDLARLHPEINYVGIEMYDSVLLRALQKREELEEKGEKFDVVILDPPAFTKSRNSIKNAVKGYREINLRAMKLVKDGGFLATCSCSHFMDYELFTKTIGQAAKNVHKRLRQVEYRTQAPDHPILWAADESYYLKFYIFQVCNDR